MSPESPFQTMTSKYSCDPGARYLFCKPLLHSKRHRTLCHILPTHLHLPRTTSKLFITVIIHSRYVANVDVLWLSSPLINTLKLVKQYKRNHHRHGT